jgi:hypothetical protein
VCPDALVRGVEQYQPHWEGRVRGVGLAGFGIGHELGVAMIGGYQRDAARALPRRRL